MRIRIIRNCWSLNDNIDHLSTNNIHVHVPVKQRTEKWHTFVNEAHVLLRQYFVRGRRSGWLVKQTIIM